MENNVTNIGQDINQEVLAQKAIAQSAGGKFKNWCKTKAWPWMKETAKGGWNAIRNALRRGIDWRGLLAFAILAYMAQNGFMDGIPETKWAMESLMRMVEWLFGLVHNLCEWIADIHENFFAPFDVFGWGEMFNQFFRNIFGL